MFLALLLVVGMKRGTSAHIAHVPVQVGTFTRWILAQTVILRVRAQFFLAVIFISHPFVFTVFLFGG